MTRAPSGLVLGVLIASAASARGEPVRHPAASRIVGGLVSALALEDSSEGSVRGGNYRGVASRVGFGLGYERRMVDWLSLSATGGFTSWINGAAIDAGYLHRRLDLAFAPHIKPVPLPTLGRLKSEIYLAIPVGLSLPFVQSPPRRAIDEQIDSGMGWHAGCSVGGALVGEHLGVFLEVGYQRHASSTRSVITPGDVSSPPIVEQRSAVDHQLIITLGSLVAF